MFFSWELKIYWPRQPKPWRRLAAPQGLEPRRAEPESAVLPLHHGAIKAYYNALFKNAKGFSFQKIGILAKIGLTFW
jgi:hypothetical protein